jgi:hypothetical protein
LAATRVLSRRHQWEQANNRVAICVDYDDAQTAAIRAGLSFDTMLGKVADNGATHVSLPELTLNRLLGNGRLTPKAPAQPRTVTPPVGHWNYLHGPADLVQSLAAELSKRLPYTEAAVLDDTLAFAGNLPTIGEIGLGFDAAAAEAIARHNLGIVPRPVSYAWPEKALLERTLAQAARFGRLVAFDGQMILGHEMHLDETLAAMAENNLSLVYFAQSRHQKGDWFIAKRRAPHVVLAHQLSPAEMVPLDLHAAAHNWAHLARERGIRFCYVNFFKVLHATAPLEGLDYIHHLKHALEDSGFVVSAEVDIPQPIPQPEAADLALTGLAPAGLTAAVLIQSLKLPEPLAVPLVLAGAAGAAALPFVEQSRNQARQSAHHHNHDHHHDHHDHDHDHPLDDQTQNSQKSDHLDHLDHLEHHDHDHDNHVDQKPKTIKLDQVDQLDQLDDHHEHDHHDHGHDHDHGDLLSLYPPSYTPKILALAAASLAPAAAILSSRDDDPFQTVWTSLVGPPAAAAALAAITWDQEYHLRIEDYKGFNLDWLLPLASAALTLPRRELQAGLLAALGAVWMLARRRSADPLAQFDPAHALGHTHHISAAQRLTGDLVIALGPHPARKWAGLGPAATLLAASLSSQKRPQAASIAALAAATGYMLGLVGFRRPERALTVTLKESVPSYLVGSAVGLLSMQLKVNSEQ